MFQQSKLEVGKLKAGVLTKIHFPYTNISAITRLESPCDCAVPQNFMTKSEIEVRYTPKPVPPQMLGQGFYLFNKKINVTYKPTDNPDTEITETLTFSGAVIA